jgi:hypothetical protein
MKIDNTFQEMTLRDYFAASALTGFLASYSQTPDPYPRKTAKACFEYADAMMEARKQ